MKKVKMQPFLGMIFEEGYSSISSVFPVVVKVFLYRRHINQKAGIHRLMDSGAKR